MPKECATLLEEVAQELRCACINRPLRASEKSWNELPEPLHRYWLDRALMVLALVAKRRWTHGDDELHAARLEDQGPLRREA